MTKKRLLPTTWLIHLISTHDMLVMGEQVTLVLLYHRQQWCKILLTTNVQGSIQLSVPILVTGKMVSGLDGDWVFKLHYPPSLNKFPWSYTMTQTWLSSTFIVILLERFCAPPFMPTKNQKFSASNCYRRPKLFLPSSFLFLFATTTLIFR